MIEIPGFKIIEKIHEGRRLNSFRAFRTSDRQRVVIKTARHESHHYLLETGYDIGRYLNPEMIVKPIELNSYNGMKYLIVEDFDAKPLSVSDTDSISMKDRLALFIKIIQSLLSIHESNIIHYDINPDNLWLNPKTTQIKIDGFGLAARKNHIKPAPEKNDIDEYQVPFISPEQTGRTNLILSQSTDLYSLGCTFYQLSTGVLPFTSQDTLELVYCHLARTPRWPHQVNPQIPEPVSDIIMKLLEKNPGNRYQSCAGIQKDLEICLTRMEKGNSNLPFTLGQHDVPSELCFSKTLYGRDKDIERLVSALKEENDAVLPLTLISGNAGVGKSSMVEQALKQAGLKAYIATGKHDRMSKQGAVRSALESLTLQILNEGTEKVDEWKERILATLGNTAQLILDLAPMLELVIGKQPPAIKLSSVENDVRMSIVIRKFIETIVFSRTSLILFLDDLQWVEPETIRILETIELYPIRGFHLICAYRDQETDSDHPFIRVINKIKNHNFQVLEIHLSPLDQETQNQWISTLFNKSLSVTRPFSRLLYEKTDGNPFFIKLFLEYLSDIKLLYQDSNHTWNWDLKQIDTLPATENVGDFMKNKISQLDSDCINLLKTASCLGSSFPLQLLKIITGDTGDSFLNVLAPVINKGVMVQHQDEIKFVHDIVQDSVYSMMTAMEKKQMHLRCGQKIQEMAGEAEMDDLIFIITDQLNAAASIVSSPEERVELALLNLKAGQKKQLFSSLQAADAYFKTGLGLLPVGAWASNYKLSLSLFSHRCEILYVLGNFSGAEYYFNQVLSHAELPDHLLRIFEAKSSYLMQSYKAQEVIDTGLMILSRLDYPLSPKFNRFYLYKEIFRFKKQMLGKKIKDLIHLPEVTDPRQAAIIRILIIISRACSLNGHPHAMILLFNSMNYILKHGINPYSAYTFSFYGTVLSHLMYDLKNGYEFGKLAVAIVEKFNAARQEILTRHLFIVISLNRLGQTRHHLDELSAVVEKSLNAGMFMNVFNLHVLYFFLLFISGTRLEELQQKMLNNRKQILDSNQLIWIHNLDLLFQTIQALMGKDRKKFLLDSPTDIYNETLPETWKKTNTIATITDYYLYRQILSYFLEIPEKSLEYAKKGEPYFRSFVSLPSQMMHRFFYAVGLLDLARRADLKFQKAYVKLIKKNYSFLKMIYLKAPENNPQMFFLIEAELAAKNKQNIKAYLYYEKAMAAAKSSGYLHIEALCCELAGKFYIDKGNQRVAHFLISEAAGLYKKWGVLSKAAQLEHDYAGLSFEEPRTEGSDANAMAFKDIDIYSVLKASQAISSEIKPQKLMQRLIRLVLENSGAQRAFLLLNTENQLRIDAFAQIHPDTVRILEGIPLEKAGGRLAKSIVHYVFLSNTTVILDNAVADSRFLYDSYINESRPVSILCTPVIGQKKILGVLYLENNLISGAFTQKHLRILEILISQVVISIENSRLYEKLRNEIKKQILSTRKIQTQQTQLRKMSSQLTQAEERERKAIADNLHDSVTQTLAMSISKLRSVKDPNDKENVIKIAETRTLLEESLTNIRSLTFQLSSPILYDVGLEAALQWLCEDFSKKYDLEIRFINSTHQPTILDETTKITLYRVVQELMMNIVKHSQSKNAMLIISSRDGCLIMSIEDNGIGFEAAGINRSAGFGLFSISERMSALNGGIQINSYPGKGTRIHIEAPIPI